MARNNQRQRPWWVLEAIPSLEEAWEWFEMIRKRREREFVTSGKEARRLAAKGFIQPAEAMRPTTIEKDENGEWKLVPDTVWVMGP
jgi:hypothetical protein